MKYERINEVWKNWFSDVFFSLSECDDLCEKVPEALRNAYLFLLLICNAKFYVGNYRHGLELFLIS
jgi:hypothetical protein